MPEQRTLYCIGGSLDGEIRTASGSFKIEIPLTKDWQSHEIYRLRTLRRKIQDASFTVQFWIADHISDAHVRSRARELFTEAAILQDEQLICE